MKVKHVLMIAAVLLAMFVIPVAAEDNNPDTEKTTILTANADAKYSITIPEGFTFASTTKGATASGNVEVNVESLDPKSVVNVFVASNGDWALNNNGYRLPYNMTVAGKTIKEDNAVVISALANDSKTVVFTLEDSATKSGAYTDTLTFTAQMEQSDLKTVDVYGLKLTCTGNNKGIITVSDKAGLLNLSKLVEDWSSLFCPIADANNDGKSYQYNDYYANSQSDYYYSWGWDIVLTADIDLENAEIAPINLGQKNVFDGQGHTIKNAKITTASTTENNAGLFSDARCSFKNLKLDNIKVTGSNEGNSCVGVLIGSCNSEISNIIITNSEATNGKYTGGVVGYSYGDIINCQLTDVQVKGGYKLGGIVGYICATSPATGEVTGNTLTDCAVDGLGNGEYAGGKSEYIIGKVVGNYNCDGTCKDNTITDMTTTVTLNIGKIESDKTVIEQ